jgi:hypothetical protein
MPRPQGRHLGLQARGLPFQLGERYLALGEILGQLLDGPCFFLGQHLAARQGCLLFGQLDLPGAQLGLGLGALDQRLLPCGHLRS